MAQSSNSNLAPKSPLLLQHDQSRAQYEKLKEGAEQISHLRNEFDNLLSLGDMISPEDIVKSASNLVSRGFDPHNLAVMLSGMPTAGGEQLQSWVQMHDIDLQKMEAQVTPVLNAARHRMGVDALHVLMEDHLSPGAASQPQQGPAASQPAMSQTPRSGMPRMGMAGPGAGSGAAPAGAGMPILSPGSPVMGRA